MDDTIRFLNENSALGASGVIRVIASIVLGASGTYLLLPHAHGRIKPTRAHLAGAALVAIALGLFVSFLKAPVEIATGFFFYPMAAMALIGAVLTIASKNPIHSALWFASVVLATSGLFLLSGAQFLAAGTVIVYAGAIIVTFLFVIMLAQMEGRATYDRTARTPFLATFSSFLLLFGLMYGVVGLRPKSTPPAAGGRPTISQPSGSTLVPATTRMFERMRLLPEQSTIMNRALPPTSLLPEATPGRSPFGNHVAGLGGTLYTEHLVTVELAGALLFAALIGAVAIATPKAPVRPQSADAAPNA